MGTLGVLNILIFSVSILYVNSCAPQKPRDRCPRTESLTQCAIVYEHFYCHGKAVGVDEDEYQKGQILLRSAVVKPDCILTFITNRGLVASTTGYNKKIDKITHFDIVNNWSYHEIWGLVGRTLYRNKRMDVSYSIPVPWPENSITASSLTCACNKHLGCPNHLPPRNRNEKSSCAVVYKHSTNDSYTSCFGHSKDINNGESAYEIEGEMWDDEISAVVVREGCTFKGYEDRGYRGASKEFTGVNEQLSGMRNLISSYKCTCKFLPIDCTPTESWVHILTCSNRDPNAPDKSCSHEISHGTSTESRTSSSYTHSQSIEARFDLELEGIFKAGLSSTTGYDWTDSTEFSKTETQQTKTVIEFSARGGEKRGLYQLQGKCGDFIVKTQYYETRNEGTGEVTERKLVSL